MAFTESFPSGLPTLPESLQSLISSIPPLPPSIHTYLSSLHVSLSVIHSTITSFLSPPPIPIYILIPLLLSTIYLFSSLYVCRRLSHFPGPKTTSFSYFWIIKTLYSGKMGHLFAETHSTYNSQTIRIGPNDLLTCDPSLIKRTSSARSKYTRSEWYKLSRVDPYDDAMLNTLDTKYHDDLKAKTAAGYAGRESGMKTEQIVDKALLNVIRVIKERYADQPGKYLDLATMSQYFTLDSIAEIAFGLEWGLVDSESDKYGTMVMLEEIAPLAVVISGVPWLRAIMGSDIVLKMIGPSPKDEKGVGRMLPMAKSVVAERFGDDKMEKEDMLQSFIRHGLTQRECETEALIQIIAGSDTTATALRATMLFLMTTPSVYQKLKKEIDSTKTKGKVVSTEEAVESGYLQGCILEGLRLFPPFTGIPFKVVPKEGDWTSDGKFIPPGTRVTPSIWATGRLKEVFGEDADLFKPERWILTKDTKEERERLAEMRRVAEMVFGYGRWGCAGKVIAFMELNKFFFELFRHFDFQLVYPFEPWQSKNHNLFLQNKMWVSVTSRE
ncbi:putative cytochrome P450 E-class, group IV [Podospora fimiseda]|uniref:Cytochrome P450 E-class, group IV n=1 Tax=Podospora fimiseda TaxID=252190 RepID=A0AAN7BQ07_9PEZI|nr:putative cytochrome P450 E-class, group IV [Podospora fimiseda]